VYADRRGAERRGIERSTEVDADRRGRRPAVERIEADLVGDEAVRRNVDGAVSSSREVKVVGEREHTLRRRIQRGGGGGKRSSRSARRIAIADGRIGRADGRWIVHRARTTGRD